MNVRASPPPTFMLRIAFLAQHAIPTSSQLAQPNIDPRIHSTLAKQLLGRTALGTPGTRAIRKPIRRNKLLADDKKPQVQKPLNPAK